MTRPLSLAACAVAAVAAGAAPAFAQARVIVEPSLALAAVYDDNLFLTPVRTGDFLWRATPGLRTSIQSRRVGLAGVYRFDAERYRTHRELDDLTAGQTGLVELTLRAGRGTKFTAGGGYDSTRVASEVNLTTGLGGGRMRAERTFGSAGLSHEVGIRTAVHAGYEYSTSALEVGPRLDAHGLTAGLARDVGARSGLYARYAAYRYEFDSLGPETTQAALVGWSHRLSPRLRVHAGLGASLLNRTVRPEAEAGLEHRAGPHSTSLTYARTRTAAVGLDGVLQVDRLAGAWIVDRPGRVEGAVRGGVFRSTTGAALTWVYQASADLIVPVAPVLALAAGYTFDLQKCGVVGGRCDRGVFTGERYRRHTALVSVIVSSRARAARPGAAQPASADVPGGRR